MTDPNQPNPNQPNPNQPGPGQFPPHPQQPNPGQFQPPPYPQGPNYGAPLTPDPVGAAPSNFFGSLFDLKFTNFVTTKVLPILYAILLVVLTVVAIIMAISAIIAGFQEGGSEAFLGILIGLIAVPIGWLIYVIILRISFEMVLVIFKIAQNTRDIVANQQSGRRI